MISQPAGQPQSPGAMIQRSRTLQHRISYAELWIIPASRNKTMSSKLPARISPPDKTADKRTAARRALNNLSILGISAPRSNSSCIRWEPFHARFLAAIYPSPVWVFRGPFHSATSFGLKSRIWGPNGAPGLCVCSFAAHAESTFLGWKATSPPVC